MRIALRLAVSFALFGAVAAHAGEGDEDGAESAPATRFEVTPFAGYRFGGDFDIQGSRRGANLNDHGSFALALDLRRDEGSQYELFYSRQETNLAPDSPLGPLGLDVEYLHIGGTLVLDEEQLLKPYLIGTLGLTRLTPEPGRSSDNTRFSFSLGAGVRVPVTEHFGLRLEGRGYLTFVDTRSSVFCASTSAGGFCAIRASGSTFIQYELLAGAAFSF
jgi:opacity protein-like surface antigen